MPYVKYAKMVRGQKWVEDLRNQSSSIDFELHLSSIAAEMFCPPVFKSWEGVHPDLFRLKSYSSTALQLLTINCILVLFILLTLRHHEYLVKRYFNATGYMGGSRYLYTGSFSPVLTKVGLQE